MAISLTDTRRDCHHPLEGVNERSRGQFKVPRNTPSPGDSGLAPFLMQVLYMMFRIEDGRKGNDACREQMPVTSAPLGSLSSQESRQLGAIMAYQALDSASA